MKKKILFIKKGSFSHINNKILQLFRHNFSDFEVEELDIEKLLLSHKLIMFINLFFLLKEYGNEFLKGKKRLKQAKSLFYCTSYLSIKIKELIRNHAKSRKYVFTFQTRSIYDCSVEDTPHFLYTDHTLLHNLNYPQIDVNHFIRSREYMKIEKMIYQHATLNFVMSSNIKHSIVHQYDVSPEKVKCIYAGNNVKVKTGSKSYGHKNILFVGIDWHRKGGPILVEAFKLVLKKHPDATLTIVGCKPYVKQKNCIEVGQVSLEEVEKHFEKASVFCMPSKREPFGIVYIEAMMHKLPIVASNIGALPDFVKNGQNGYLTNNSIQATADALIDLLSHPEKCKSFGERSYEIASQNYQWNLVGKKMKMYIDSVLYKPSSIS